MRTIVDLGGIDSWVVGLCAFKNELSDHNREYAAIVDVARLPYTCLKDGAKAF
jgi:hypothetical protein